MTRALPVVTALLLLLAPAQAALADVGQSGQPGWVWPLEGDVITPYRNGDDPYAAGQHRGIDIAGPVGAPVVAAARGEVLFAGTAGSSGLTVSVRTPGGLDTSYLHLSSASVREGDSVAAGERIGAVGVSGSRSAEAPHLHFGVRESGTRHSYRDPLTLLPPAPRTGRPAEPPAPMAAPEPLAAPQPLPAPVPRGPAARRIEERRRLPRERRVPARRAPRRVTTPQRAPRGAEPAPAGRAAPVPAHPPSLSDRLPARAAPATPLSAPPRRRGARGEVPRSAGAATGPAGSPVPAHARPAGAGRPPGPPAAARAPSASAGGPDIGWGLACAGLLLAAAILGLSEDGRRTSRALGGRLARRARPLLSRR